MSMQAAEEIARRMATSAPELKEHPVARVTPLRYVCDLILPEDDEDDDVNQEIIV